MSTLLIAIPVWTGIALLAVIMPKFIAFFEAPLELPPFREEHIPRYALFAVWASCVVGLIVLLTA
jgi:hypothetical protein